MANRVIALMMTMSIIIMHACLTTLRQMAPLARAIISTTQITMETDTVIEGTYLTK